MLPRRQCKGSLARGENILGTSVLSLINNVQRSNADAWGLELGPGLGRGIALTFDQPFLESHAGFHSCSCRGSMQIDGRTRPDLQSIPELPM